MARFIVIYHSLFKFKFSSNLSYCKPFSIQSVHLKKNTLNINQISKLSLKFLKNKPSTKSGHIIPKPVVPIITGMPSDRDVRKGSKPDWKERKLSKILLEKISELIVTSELGSQVMGKGLEITQIQFGHGFSSLKVYWASSNEDTLEELNTILQKAAPLIRYQLCTQNIMGKVPPILFIRDKKQELSQQVIDLLREADFGPDYDKEEISTTQSVHAQDDISPSSSRHELLMEEKTSQGAVGGYDLKHDVLGVDRQKIMIMIKRKCVAPHRKELSEDTSLNPTPFETLAERGSKLAPFSCSYSRATEISKWMKQYKKDRRYQARREKKEIKRDINALGYITPEDAEEEGFSERMEEFEDDDDVEYYEEENER